VTENGKHVLVVEDSPAIARVVQFNLELAGFRVTVAGNGVEALRCAQQTQFDLVVTDQQMPEMNGVEWCRRLREQIKHEHTPLVFLSAKEFELDLAKLRDHLNITATLPKPFSPRQLLSTVEACLGASEG
jgi:CheY-like chemotaxis protein